MQQTCVEAYTSYNAVLAQQVFVVMIHVISTTLLNDNLKNTSQGLTCHSLSVSRNYA